MFQYIVQFSLHILNMSAYPHGHKCIIQPYMQHESPRVLKICRYFRLIQRCQLKNSTADRATMGRMNMILVVITLLDARGIVGAVVYMGWAVDKRRLCRLCRKKTCSAYDMQNYPLRPLLLGHRGE
jgi:hypothetical protein